MRHMPFAIGILERDQWLACMDQAMAETGVPADLSERWQSSFFETSVWIRTTP
jgi:hemoglobin